MAFTKRVVNDPFVLLDEHRAGRVYDVATSLGAVDCCQNQFLLNARAGGDVFVVFGRLGRRILGDDSSSAAWSVQQDATVSLSDLWPFPNQYSGRALLVFTIT